MGPHIRAAPFQHSCGGAHAARHDALTKGYETGITSHHCSAKLKSQPRRKTNTSKAS